MSTTTVLWKLYFEYEGGTLANMFFSTQRKAELARDLMLAEGVEKPLEIVRETTVSSTSCDSVWEHPDLC